MDKHVLLVVVVLLIVSTQAHNQNLRERSSSSSSGTSTWIVSSLASINAGDPPVVPPLESAVNLRSSSSSYDADLIDGYTDFQSTVSSSAAGSATFAGSTTSSKAIDNTIHLGNIFGASSSDETGITEEDTASSTSSQSESERASLSTIALNRSSTFTTSSSRQSSSTPSSFDIFEDGSSYSVGTVSLNEERSDIESTKLELSTSHEAASSHSSRSSKKATSTTDPAASAIQDGDDANKNNSTKDLTSSNLSSRNPILYACVVLAVAGLAGGIFAFRAKRKRDDEWIVSEPSANAPPPRHDPPPSQVHVVIDDNHFALL